jgi:asparagine synthase (glutamine-hydrolysing)
MRRRVERVDFVVLPDHPATTGIAGRLATASLRTLHHDSGRPWIVGQWRDDELTLARAGATRVALLGRTTASEEWLAGRLSRVRTRADLDSLASDVPGCVHLVGSVDGHIRAQGSLASAYRIFHAVVEGVTVAAARPDHLVRLTGATLDDRLLALCLLAPYARPPWPVGERCLWRGVHLVPPGHWLGLDPAGAHRVVRWWSAPGPVMSLAEGAALVRARVFEAVQARAAGGARLTMDLSGGMDSTSLCYVAHRSGLPFTTLHHCTTDPVSQDAAWAERCRRDLTSAAHLVVPGGSLAGAYADSVLAPPPARLEGPATQIHQGTIMQIADLLARSGGERHLRGDGGDELFKLHLTGAAAQIRRHPVRHWRSVLRFRARNRYSPPATVRSLRGPGSYRDWLRRKGQELSLPFDGRVRTEWDLPLRMPPWATPDAVTTVMDLYREAVGADPHPMVDDAGDNEIFRLLQISGETARQCTDVNRRLGVTYEVPYVDDRVINAVLSIRPGERAAPGVNKPVLTAAMRGVVPEDVLTRTDKSNGNREAYDDLRRNRDRLVEMCDDPLLAGRGLIDADRLRPIALGMHADLKPLVALGPTWCTEMWLRGLAAARSEGLDAQAMAND